MVFGSGCELELAALVELEAPPEVPAPVDADVFAEEDETVEIEVMTTPVAVEEVVVAVTTKPDDVPPWTESVTLPEVVSVSEEEVVMVGVTETVLVMDDSDKVGEPVEMTVSVWMVITPSVVWACAASALRRAARVRVGRVS